MEPLACTRHWEGGKRTFLADINKSDFAGGRGLLGWKFLSCASWFLENFVDLEHI